MEDYFFQVSKEDAATMGENVTLPTIQLVLDLIQAGLLPTPTEAKDFRDNPDRTAPMKAEISHNATARRSVKIPLQTNEDIEVSTDIAVTEGISAENVGDINRLLGEDYTDEDASDSQGPKTIYDINNAFIDRPMKNDLNSISTVKGLVDYWLAVCKLCLADDTDDPYSHWPAEAIRPIPFMDQFGPILCNDGSPTFALLRLSDTDEYRDKLFTAFNGGFHTMLENHKMRGRMFGDAHLREIWVEWRPTDGQLNWVFNPGDPTQVDNELVFYYLAFIASAVHACLDSKIESGLTGDDLQLTAVEVHDFIVERCSKSPIGCQFLNEIRFAETVFLMHQSEEESNADKYVTALKFSSLLFATNNAIKYAEIASRFFKWWHCASEADKKLYACAIMTKLTKEGKKIFIDRFFEWHIRDMRSLVGHHYRAGSDSRVERHALTLNFKKHLTDVFKDETGKSDKRKGATLKEGKVFCHVLSYLEEAGFWTNDNSDRRKLTDKSKELNIDIINAPQTGERRMRSFMAAKVGAGMSHAEFSNRAEEDESNIVAMLKRVYPTTEKQQEEDDRKIERSTTTKMSDIEKYYYKPELVEEWNYVKSIYEAREWVNDLPKLNGSNKEHYARAICEAREFIKRKDATWRNNREAAIRQEINTRIEETNNTINEKMEEASQSLFFRLSVSDSVREAYSEKVSIKPREEQRHSQLSQTSIASQISAGASFLMDI